MKVFIMAGAAIGFGLWMAWPFHYCAGLAFYQLFAQLFG
jgi:hypothetical protein